MNRIVGPLVGGFLSKPEENFPALVHLMPWLRKVRYWIPCFVGGLLCLFTVIFTAFAAPETLSREKAKKAKQEKKRNAKKVVIIDKKLKQGILKPQKKHKEKKNKKPKIKKLKKKMREVEEDAENT